MISYYFHVTILTIATTVILNMEWNTSCGISIFHLLKKGEGLLHACISRNTNICKAVAAQTMFLKCSKHSYLYYLIKQLYTYSNTSIESMISSKFRGRFVTFVVKYLVNSFHNC
jgi:hypothetical protein